MGLPRKKVVIWTFSSLEKNNTKFWNEGTFIHSETLQPNTVIVKDVASLVYYQMRLWWGSCLGNLQLNAVMVKGDASVLHN